MPMACTVPAFFELHVLSGQVTQAFMLLAEGRVSCYWMLNCHYIVSLPQGKKAISDALVISEVTVQAANVPQSATVVPWSNFTPGLTDFVRVRKNVHSSSSEGLGILCKIYLHHGRYDNANVIILENKQ